MAVAPFIVVGHHTTFEGKNTSPSGFFFHIPPFQCYISVIPLTCEYRLLICHCCKSTKRTSHNELHHFPGGYLNCRDRGHAEKYSTTDSQEPSVHPSSYDDGIVVMRVLLHWWYSRDPGMDGAVLVLIHTICGLCPCLTRVETESYCLISLLVVQTYILRINK